MKRKLISTGISLLEVLLSITIIGIILVMGTRYFFVASNNDRINTTRQEIGAVLSAIQNWKNQNPQYSASLNISALYNAGFLADSTSLVTSGNPPNATATLFSPWGQPIYVVGSGVGASITVSLPKNSDCIALQNSFPDGLCSLNNFSLQVS